MSQSISPMQIQNNSLLDFDKSVVSEIFIRKLVLRESGTYNNQFARSYEAHLNPQSVNALSNKAAESGMGVFRPSVLSGYASNMISISAAPESNNPLAIQNGWGSKRLLFFMDVLTKDLSGAETAHYIQGYTDYIGMSLQNKHLDPAMVFYINNIISSRIMQPYNTPQGMMSRQSIVGTDHLIYNTQPNTGDQQWMMRPEDVFKVLTTQYYGNHISSGMHDAAKPTMLDQRWRLSNSPKMSDRMNAVPTNYASRLINGFLTAGDQVDPTAPASDRFDASVNNVSDRTPNLNPFLTALSRKRSTGVVSGTFYWKDILLLDPQLGNPGDQRLTVAINGPTQMRTQHNAGMTADWSGASIETKYAATISQAIPAIMLECMLYNVSFSSNNHMRLEGSTNGIITVMTNGQAMHGGPAINEIENFKRRLEMEVLRDISYNNQQKFDIQVQASVFSDTWLKISIDGGPYYDFVTPTFCDGIITPVITHDHNKIDNVASGVDLLVSQVSDALHSGNERHVFSIPQTQKHASGYL